MSRTDYQKSKNQKIQKSKNTKIKKSKNTKTVFVLSRLGRRNVMCNTRKCV
jgi:hypothetical protein